MCIDRIDLTSKAITDGVDVTINPEVDDAINSTQQH